MLDTVLHEYLMSELAHYDYRLPRHLIAQCPLPRRSDARLMVVDRADGSLSHRHVRDLPELLRPGDCLVINDTRVVPARLIGHRAQTGGRWEGLFLSTDVEGHWRLLSKARGRLGAGEPITLVNRFGDDDVSLRLIEKLPGGVWMAHPETDEPAFELLGRVGRVPLPHYIRGGEMVDDDRQQYQTVYARHPGSVAAPTAGLHFTDELMARVVDRGVTPVRLTLHVGLDTFRPISTAMLAQHPMSKERGQIDAAAVEQIACCRAAGGRVVAVGTTTVRLLETAGQSGTLQPWSGETDLFIRPPYRFKVVDALMTNFHLPRTTLLVLVRAFGGDELLSRAYASAIEEKYRFFSYGDAMLIV
ncbi:MAG TPA: tRNA preQ1(34) S-adenosylmethionine ribosyltransferase-isomerase QueA [Pirellulales bacterium]|jgi:S-adenosylmethionine:tRNA ribosyltransferase-isomerase|nr:tRNA preQ1(34) S-adenosylmethionine ribosyltransferase-isomerase QueA [Pirellulales bacterium]